MLLTNEPDFIYRPQFKTVDSEASRAWRKAYYKDRTRDTGLPIFYWVAVIVVSAFLHYYSPVQGGVNLELAVNALTYLLSLVQVVR